LPTCCGSFYGAHASTRAFDAVGDAAKSACRCAIITSVYYQSLQSISEFKHSVIDNFPDFAVGTLQTLNNRKYGRVKQLPTGQMLRRKNTSIDCKQQTLKDCKDLQMLYCMF